MDEHSARKMKTNDSLLTDVDLFLFNEGSHTRIYEKMGAHPVIINGCQGTFFAVWAPNARRVSVIGDFNNWDRARHWLYSRGKSGIWEGFIPGIGKGSTYKYHISSKYNGYEVDKADPIALFNEKPPAKASVVWDISHDWLDMEWMQKRGGSKSLEEPVSIYEVHLGSWKRKADENNRPLTYREITDCLIKHVKQMGFTHIEFLPVMEHPFYGSWGYQTTGYFAPTSRYGSPQDFMSLIDALHQQGIGVILDWVPSHFPADEYGLGYFDGTHLYEHEDPRTGIHPDWNSCIFNYGRNEVRSFLLSSAQFWLEKYHIDAIRVDAVASMLYLDYSRKKGEWIPNKYGGRENLDAIIFLHKLNEMVYKEQPGADTIAEESAAWPGVTHPIYNGGLGFGYKWDMGWMHDTLDYMKQDPVFRKYHHNNLTFRKMYAYSENYVLPFSHDEVVYGKGSLLSKMPGDNWQKFAGLRLLFGYMYTLPGKKLLFMGGEFGQIKEWDHEQSLDWQLLDNPFHAGIKRWVEDLNRLYRRCPALFVRDHEPGGFEWVDCSDIDHSIISYLRLGKTEDDILLVICNFTPVTHFNYRIGVPRPGYWKELLNSDARDYGGSGQGNLGGTETSEIPFHARPYSLGLTIPPLSIEIFKPDILPDL
jgi:1,4-alpha-glucan branching enzyme